MKIFIRQKDDLRPLNFVLSDLWVFRVCPIKQNVLRFRNLDVAMPSHRATPLRTEDLIIGLVA